MFAPSYGMVNETLKDPPYGARPAEGKPKAICGFEHGVLAVALHHQQGAGPDVALSSLRALSRGTRFFARRHWFQMYLQQ